MEEISLCHGINIFYCSIPLSVFFIWNINRVNNTLYAIQVVLISYGNIFFRCYRYNENTVDFNQHFQNW